MSKTKKKIEKLTPEQEARYGEFVEKWTKIGHCTEPTDRDAVPSALEKVYRAGGLEPPETIVYTGSPVGNLFAFTEWEKDAATPTRIEYLARKAVDQMVHHDGPKPSTQHLSGSIFGSHEWWLCYYDFFREAVGLVEETQPLEGLIALSKCAGWVLTFREIAFVSERHNQLHLRDGRIHCEDGPAIGYPDGWGVYGLNGVRVPRWLVMTDARDIDPMRFAKIQNVEVRREFVRKIGAEQLVQNLGADIVDEAGDYSLLLVDLGGDTGKWPYLKMRNPSIGTWHIEAVDRSCDTVQKALNWRNGGEFEHIAPMT